VNSGLSANEEVQADDLTWREQEVLLLLADRCSNREIAGQLHLAESTVKDYVGKILSKLYVKNRRQAVERARELGFFDHPPAEQSRSQINLPAEPTPFVGRRDELAEIQHLLSKTRLLTLVGPGGIGKTRLALKAARQSASEFKNGVFFYTTSPDQLGRPARANHCRSGEIPPDDTGRPAYTAAAVSSEQAAAAGNGQLRASAGWRADRK
jgi:ATP/maltotriose-dependent transcriptional regulator MalT